MDEFIGIILYEMAKLGIYVKPDNIESFDYHSWDETVEIKYNIAGFPKRVTLNLNSGPI